MTSRCQYRLSRVCQGRLPVSVIIEALNNVLRLSRCLGGRDGSPEEEWPPDRREPRKWTVPIAIGKRELRGREGREIPRPKPATGIDSSPHWASVRKTGGHLPAPMWWQSQAVEEQRRSSGDATGKGRDGSSLQGELPQNSTHGRPPQTVVFVAFVPCMLVTPSVCARPGATSIYLDCANLAIYAHHGARNDLGFSIIGR